MSGGADIWAIIPVKDTEGAKQRLASVLSAPVRRELALAMLEDVLAAVSQARGLAGIVLVTADRAAIALARGYGAETIADGAQAGHTGAVDAGIRQLTALRRGTMLTMPGDVPLASAAEIEALIAAHGPPPAFTIAPAHDELGSNAIVMSPPQAVPLRFGDDSFFPHLDAARAAGIEPRIVRLPGIGLDIDNPRDLDHFSRLGSTTRAGRLIAAHAPEITITTARSGVPGEEVR